MKSTSERLKLRSEIVNYVQSELQHRGRLPSRYNICRKFGISWRTLYKIVFNSTDVAGKTGRDLFQAMGISLPSPNSIKAITRNMQKMMRVQVLERDNNKCIVCGSQVRLELAHIFPCLISNNYPYGTKSEVEKVISPHFKEENLLILCRRCHMLFDFEYLWLTIQSLYKPEEAREKMATVLLHAGIKPSDLQEKEKVKEKIRRYMHELYGERYFERLCLALHISKKSESRRQKVAENLGI